VGGGSGTGCTYSSHYTIDSLKLKVVHYIPLALYSRAGDYYTTICYNDIIYLKTFS